LISETACTETYISRLIQDFSNFFEFPALNIKFYK
jgi:hypothetical protein